MQKKFVIIINSLLLSIVVISCFRPNQNNDEEAAELLNGETELSSKKIVNQQLCELVAQQNIDFDTPLKQRLDSLIRAGANVNCTCEITDTYTKTGIGSGYYFRKFFGKAPKTVSYVIEKPLPHFAFYSGNDSLINYLLYRKANYNIANKEGENLLVAASLENDSKAIQKLIALGCKPKDMSVIKTTDTEIVDLLVKHGVDVNKIDYDVVLANTSLLNERETINFIKKRNPSFKNKKVNLDGLFFWNAELVLELLKHGMDVNTTYKETSLLAKALQEENNLVVEFILSNGFDIKKDEMQPYCALFAAIENNNKMAFDKLIAMGANVHHEGEKTGNAYHFCAANKKNGVAFAEELFLKRVKLNSCNYNGTTLYTAVAEENTKMCKWLIAKGISPNTLCKKDGENPLFEAISANNLELVKLLVDSKADLNAKNVFDETPFQVAKKRGYTNIIAFLNTKK